MNRLKELREEAMMTVRELSERSGVSEDTITKIENGHRKGRGMTLRKLAKALGVRPYQLSPEYFKGLPRTEESALEILPQDDLSSFETTSTRSPDTGVNDAPTLKATLLQAFEVVGAVEAQSSLGVQAHLQSLTERQRRLLLTLVTVDGLNPAEVAELLEISVSTAYRDLVMLEEYGLVCCDELDQRRPTSLGEGVAGVLAKGGFYYGDALRYIATLMDAYEPVAGNDQRGSNEVETFLVLELQASVVRLIRRIMASAEPPPQVEKVRNSLLTDAAGIGVRITQETLVEKIRRGLNRCMDEPPPRQIIQADIEGVPEDDVLEALGTVLAAHRTGHGAADPYKNFRWNLKRHSRQSTASQESDTDDPKQASVRPSDS